MAMGIITELSTTGTEKVNYVIHNAIINSKVIHVECCQSLVGGVEKVVLNRSNTGNMCSLFGCYLFRTYLFTL